MFCFTYTFFMEEMLIINRITLDIYEMATSDDDVEC